MGIHCRLLLSVLTVDERDCIDSDPAEASHEAAHGKDGVGGRVRTQHPAANRQRVREHHGRQAAQSEGWKEGYTRSITYRSTPRDLFSLDHETNKSVLTHYVAKKATDTMIRITRHFLTIVFSVVAFVCHSERAHCIIYTFSSALQVSEHIFFVQNTL